MGCFHFEIIPQDKGILMIGTKKACKKLHAWLKLICEQQEEILKPEAKMTDDSKELENAVKCEFEIQQDLIKYAIGRQGSNIQAAKQIKDIIDVKIDEDTREGVSRNGWRRPKILITANTQDAIDEARDLLEIVRRKLDVPKI